MIEACPKCGGIATLVQTREDFEEIPDLSNPSGKIRVGEGGRVPLPGAKLRA